MDCQICNIYADNIPVKSNNCIIECLEKIKLHYMDMLKKIDDDNLAMKSLNQRNLELQEKIASYERSSKKEPLLFSPECDGSDWCSDVMENEILNKTVDSLNVALNDENDFETSYVNDSPNSYQKHKLLKRDPMKPKISANGSIGLASNDVSKKIKDEFPDIKKESSFLSKENKSILHRHSSRRADKSLFDRPKLSLKSGLRQSRLQLNIKKKPAINELSIGQQSLKPSLSMSDVSKSYRNASRRQDDSIGQDQTFELASPIKKNILPKETTFMPKNESETSSVMILTPETQDIIFLDDRCNSNIESMDLLRDFVRPSNNRLTNLKLFESNRIKLLQKTASTKTITVHNNNEKQSDQSCNNSMLEETNLNESSASTDLEDDQNESRNSKEQANSSRDERLLKLNCAECEKYIRYLGHRLTDEEIERHIRNCTKHKINAEINCTPDGFWDPKIKPLAKDDPRIKELVDTRFVRK